LSSTTESIHQSQTLLIDADDTLWENNIYFERAIVRFISFLNHHEFSPEQVREVLNDVERECIVKHGYGLHSFAHALVDTFERLSVQPVTPELHAQITSFAHTFADHPIELLPEVAQTLHYLSTRHRLILVTKGALAEQTGKIERSGLKKYFAATEIVAEKDSAAYQALIEKHSLARNSTWMVGNSPQVRHQSGAGRGIARGLRTPWRYLDPGTRSSECRSAVAAVAHRGPFRGIAGTLLGCTRRCSSARARFSPRQHQTNQQPALAARCGRMLRSFCSAFRTTYFGRGDQQFPQAVAHRGSSLRTGA
jgi:putative hydrolase of the HAD superfamily